MNIIIFENPHIKRAGVAAAPALPLTPSCPSQTLAIAQRLGQSARTHRVSEGIQASNSFTNGRSAARTEHTRKKQKTQKLNQNHTGGVGRWGLQAGGLGPVPRSYTSRIPPICCPLDSISCSMRSVVMPHSATSSVRGDEISTTVSWNSGV